MFFILHAFGEGSRCGGTGFFVWSAEHSRSRRESQWLVQVFWAETGKPTSVAMQKQGPTGPLFAWRRDQSFVGHPCVHGEGKLAAGLVSQLGSQTLLNLLQDHEDRSSCNWVVETRWPCNMGPLLATKAAGLCSMLFLGQTAMPLACKISLKES